MTTSQVARMVRERPSGSGRLLGKSARGMEDRRCEDDRKGSKKQPKNRTKESISQLRILRESYMAVQQKGKESQALDCLEKGFMMKREIFGPASKWTRNTELDYARCANIVGVKMIRTGRIEKGSELLLKAQELVRDSAHAQVATLNNIAMCLFSQELVEDALAYLWSALKKQEQKTRNRRKGARKPHVEEHFLAETHLNISACLHKMGKSQAAVIHAQHAVCQSQKQLRRLETAALPECFFREALMVLLLSYHGLGHCLRALGTQKLQDESDLVDSITCVLNGVKVHMKAFEEGFLLSDALVRPELKISLWESFVLACLDTQAIATNALSLNLCQGNDEWTFLCRVIVEQAKAVAVQKWLRRNKLKKETRAAISIQRPFRHHLQQTKTRAAIALQAKARGWLARKRLRIGGWRQTASEATVRTGLSSPQRRKWRKARAKKKRDELVRAKLERERKKELEHLNRVSTRNQPSMTRGSVEDEEVNWAEVKRELLAERSKLRKLSEQRKLYLSRMRSKQLTEGEKEALRESIDQWAETQRLQKRRIFEAFRALRENKFGPAYANDVAMVATHAPELAARTIQARWRGHIVQQDFANVQAGVGMIQRAFRGFQEYRANKMRGIVNSVLLSFQVSVLQNLWRKKKTKRRDDSACKIQCVWRSRSTRMRIELNKEKATEVQKLWRGYSVRKQIWETEQDFDRKVIKIQAWMRKCQAEQLVHQVRKEAIAEREALKLHLELGMMNGRRSVY